MGNSIGRKSGIAGLSLKDLRVWSGLVSSAQTAENRQRQLYINKYSKEGIP